MPTARVWSLARLPRKRALYATKTAPPEPRPYKPIAPSERVSRPGPSQTAEQAAQAAQAATPKKKSLITRLFSLRPEEAQINEPRDIARGIAATQRVVSTGVLDPRYRPASRRILAIIVALPLVIGLGYELFQRRFFGKERKARPVRKLEGAMEEEKERAPS